GVKVTHVLRGSAAEAAGLSSGDELLAIDDWRLRRLDDAQRLMQPGAPANVLVSRDQRVLTPPVTLPQEDATPGALSLAPDAKAPRAAQVLRKAWLTG